MYASNVGNVRTAAACSRRRHAAARRTSPGWRAGAAAATFARGGPRLASVPCSSSATTRPKARRLLKRRRPRAPGTSASRWSRLRYGQRARDASATCRRARRRAPAPRRAGDRASARPRSLMRDGAGIVLGDAADLAATADRRRPAARAPRPPRSDAGSWRARSSRTPSFVRSVMSRHQRSRGSPPNDERQSPGEERAPPTAGRRGPRASGRSRGSTPSASRRAVFFGPAQVATAVAQAAHERRRTRPTGCRPASAARSGRRPRSSPRTPSSGSGRAAAGWGRCRLRAGARRSAGASNAPSRRRLRGEVAVVDADVGDGGAAVARRARSDRRARRPSRRADPPSRAGPAGPATTARRPRARRAAPPRPKVIGR